MRLQVIWDIEVNSGLRIINDALKKVTTLNQASVPAKCCSKMNTVTIICTISKCVIQLQNAINLELVAEFVQCSSGSASKLMLVFRLKTYFLSWQTVSSDIEFSNRHDHLTLNAIMHMIRDNKCYLTQRSFSLVPKLSKVSTLSPLLPS